MTPPGNWGRWGAEDERGALNLIDPEAVQRGVSCVRQGLSVSLGVPVRSGHGPVAGHRAPPQHLMTRDGGDYAAGLPESGGYGFADDAIIVGCHGTTHLDALSHVWQAGLMWNGFPSTAVTSIGAKRCGVENVGPITTRALFLDLAGDGPGLTAEEPITADRLQQALDERGLTPESGDALLVRTGWLKQWREGRATVNSWPGLQVGCAEWLQQHDFSVIGADNIGVEVFPSGIAGAAMPLHVAVIRDLGMYFLELLDFEALALHKVSRLLLVVAPLNIVGGVGSPCAPVAMF